MIVYEYKGQEIEFLEYGEKWDWQGFSHQSLQKVKEYIDRNLPKRWKPTPAFYQGYNNELKEVLVKSAAADGSLWIKSDKKQRGEKAYRTLYKTTEHNRALLAEVAALEEQRAAFGSRIDSLMDQMEVFRAADIEVDGSLS